MCQGASVGAPNVPAPDPNQIALEQQQLKALNDQYSLTKGLLPAQTQEMGLVYDPNTGTYGLSDQAKQQLQSQQSLVGGQTQLGLASLPIAQDYMNMEGTSIANEQSMQPEDLAIRQQMADREKQALAGNLPLPSAMQDQKAQQWQQFVRQQASQGNNITGDTPETAVASSTVGQQALKDFNTQWNNTQNAWQLNQLNTQTGLYQSGTAQGAGLAQSGYGASQGYANPTGYTAANPTFNGAMPSTNYLGLASGYGAAQQPYQYNQGMQFQSNAQGSQNFSGLLGSLMGAGGQMGAAYMLA